MTEDICDVKGCRKVSDYFTELVQTKQTRVLLILPSSRYETKLFARLCKDHYDLFWDSALDILKGK